ncbi:hypothetical protein BDR04DRAFT_1123378, partial [Suillus decipiens]
MTDSRRLSGEWVTVTKSRLKGQYGEGGMAVNDDGVELRWWWLRWSRSCRDRDHADGDGMLRLIADDEHVEGDDKDAENDGRLWGDGTGTPGELSQNLIGASRLQHTMPVKQKQASHWTLEVGGEKKLAPLAITTQHPTLTLSCLHASGSFHSSPEISGSTICSKTSSFSAAFGLALKWIKKTIADPSSSSKVENEATGVELGILNDDLPHALPPSTSRCLLCPPEELVESPCNFASCLGAMLCYMGLYLPGEKGMPGRWMERSHVPDFHAEHGYATTRNMVKFLNILIDQAACVVMERTGMRPSVVRKWTAAAALVRMPGCPIDQKLDLVAISDASPKDWRTVDCVIDVACGEAVQENGQLSERAKDLFSIQDDRRFVILICLRQDEFNYAVFDRGGSIMTPFLK